MRESKPPHVTRQLFAQPTRQPCGQVHKDLKNNLFLLTKIIFWLQFQHFPLYRKSDAVCTDPDAPPLPERNKEFTPRYDSLSKEATDFLATRVKPKVVFGGHTHHGCLQHHVYEKPEPFEFEEYSVPSFSWRNRPNPKFMLLSIFYWIFRHVIVTYARTWLQLRACVRIGGILSEITVIS